MDAVFLEEREHLKETKAQYDTVIGDAQLLFEGLPSLYGRDPDLLNDLLLQTHNRIARLTGSREKPYFARIDFTDGESGETAKCYIGKIGVSDGDGRIVTVDWRAPVATLYYDSNLGRVSYQAPGGRVEGTLHLKRQLEIQGGELLSLGDVDTVSNDELLRPYLGVNADNRLKNIVASIQSEQNRIIRERIEKNLVVQGAAGSGKTTVALHRIAYLVYTYREKIKPGQYLVIGPNPFFISYISSVLPDLDVDSVPQHTFSSLVREFIGEEYTVSDPNETLRRVVDGSYPGGPERFKTSMACKQTLDRFLQWFEESVLPKEDFFIRGFAVLTAEEVSKAYQNARLGGESAIGGRVEKCIRLLSALIAGARDRLELRLSNHFRALYPGAGDSKELQRLHRDREFIEKELENGCRRSLKKFLGRADMKILPLYQLYLQECPRFWDPAVPGLEAYQKKTLAALRKKTLSPEDLPALAYLKIRQNGPGDYKEYRHAIVDEAQDYGEFELYTLRKLLCGSTFTVVGDLAQSIFGYRSIENWEQVLNDSFCGEAQLLKMQKSYRTTVEIMEAANLVAGQLGLPPALPVIRHGNPVRVRPRDMAAIAKTLGEYLSLGFSSAAVICKTQKESQEMGDALRALGLPIETIRDDNLRYVGGLCTITAYQAKGLEFDGAILPDACETVYRKESRTEMILLYVAMTRPLHRLDIFCEGRPAAPLAALWDS